MTPKMSRTGATRVVALALLVGALALPHAATADDAAGADPTVAFERYTLDNGLEVILHQDNRIPLVAVNVWYHVGSGDEVHGRSGFAHLFEHMLFQGSKHVGEDRHFEVLKNVGATGVNGTTSTDRTNYFQIVPSHQIEVGLWLESDRMGYLLPLLTQESLDNQIEVVRNERRQRIDNVPYGKTWVAMYKHMYPEGHPYRYMVIGRHEDLAAATLDDVINFYKTWYVPANATLTLAGDFELEDAKRLVHKWFGSFPRSVRPQARKVAAPEVQRQRVELADEFAKLRKLTYVWHSPASFAPGDAELDILANALTQTGTGRLYRSLVHERQLAQSVVSYQRSQQLSSLFVLDVTVKTGASLEEVEKVLAEELERIAREPINPEELQRAITSVESGFVWGLESLMARAERLQYYNHHIGNPDYITQDLDRYRKATPEKIREYAARHLQRGSRLELVTIPADGGK
jgi:zinc protease